MKIIKHLLKKRIVNNEIVENAKRFKEESTSLISGLYDQVGVEEYDLLNALSEFFDLPKADFDSEAANIQNAEIIPRPIIEKYQVFPFLLKDADTLVIAVCDPLDLRAFDDIREVCPFEIEILLATKREIGKRIADYLEARKRQETYKKIVESTEPAEVKNEEPALEDNGSTEPDDSALVNLVNEIIFDAVKEKASDIHIEPKEKCVEIRFRIDGVLYIKRELPKGIQKQLISRMKIMAELDISEHRRPQDGRIKIDSNGQNVDTRISTIPTIFGEKIVLRILDTSDKGVEIEGLGLRKDDQDIIDNLIQQPQGLVLVCGPTGSGKTTTLYGALKRIANKEKNIVTIEDPVEYVVDGINQIQVNEKIGVTFASGLRSVLRQDPDCILVGEIRDGETGDMAFRASLTGHLVFSTLHTNSVFSSITRLKNLGIEPFIIASSLLGIVSQRLVRCNCTHCSERYIPDEMLIDKFEKYIYKSDPSVRFLKGQGCKQCNGLGYRERTVVAEVLSVDAKIKEMIINGASEWEIRRTAQMEGFRSMMDDAIEKVLTGVTTLEEVDRILGNHEQINTNNIQEDRVEEKGHKKPLNVAKKISRMISLPDKNQNEESSFYVRPSALLSKNDISRYFDFLTGY